MLAMTTIGEIGIFLSVLIVIISIIAAIPVESEEAKKKRLAALRGEIPAAFAKAQKAATACLEMQKAAIMAEACYSAASLDDKQWKSSDGPTEQELLKKAEAASFKALSDLKRLSVESVNLSPTSCDYVNLRTYCRLAHTTCEVCDPQVCQGNCQALDILKKIKLS